jgi:hypothetical protein
MQSYRGYASFSDDICGAWFGFGSGFGIGFTGTLLLAHAPLLLSTLLSHTIPFPHSRSLVCGGQTSPHKPRLVVSHSTCSPQSSSPHTHIFVLGTAVINNNSFIIGTAVINTHQQRVMGSLVYTVLGSSSLVAHVLHSPPPPHANSFIKGTAVINTHTNILPRSQRNQSDSYCFKRLAFYQSLKSKSSLIGVGQVRGLRGGRRGGWCEEWARSG